MFLRQVFNFFQESYQEKGKSHISRMSCHAILWDTLPLVGLHVLHYYCVQCAVGSGTVKADLGRVYRPRFMCLRGERENPMLPDVRQEGPFLGAFAKLRRAIISFVISCLSHWTDFHEILYLNIFFSKICREIQVSLKSDKNNGHFT